MLTLDPEWPHSSKQLYQEKYKNSALYHGAILWNMLPVNIRNIDSFDSFKAHQKKAMKENG